MLNKLIHYTIMFFIALAILDVGFSMFLHPRNILTFAIGIVVLLFAVKFIQRTIGLNINAGYYLKTFSVMVFKGIGSLFVNIDNLYASSLNNLKCPHCNTAISLLGIHECVNCKFRYRGRKFSKCPHCKTIADYLECHKCHLHVRRPWV